MDSTESVRHNFVKTGSLLYATSTEFGDGTLAKDAALHCDVVFGVIHNLLDGYRYYSHSIPHWFRQGVAHWYLRRVDEKYPVFYEYKRFDARPEMLWNWPPRVRARVEFGEFPRAAELLRWRESDEAKLTDSMMVWSRVDYLMNTGNEKALRVYLDAMTGPIPMKGRQPTRDEILSRQEHALREAWDLDAESFDARWSAWVREEYPRK